MKAKPEHASNDEHNKNKEEDDHNYIRHLVDEIFTEELLTFCEKVEGEVLNIAFVNDEQESSIERVFPQHQGNSVVKEDLEDYIQEEMYGQNKRQFEEEKIEVICVKPDPIWIFFQEIRACVVVLLIESANKSVVARIYAFTE